MIVLFGLGLTGIMLLSQVFSSRRDVWNLVFSLILVCIAMLQARYVYASSDLSIVYPRVFIPELFFWVILGPVIYAHTGNLTEADFHIAPQFYLLLVPALAALIFECSFFLEQHTSLVSLSGQGLFSFYAAFRVAGLLYLLAFLVIFIVRVLRFGNFSSMDRKLRYAFLTYIIPVMAVILVLLASATGNEVLNRTGFVLFTLHMALWIVVEIHIPELFLLVKEEIRKNRYERSLLGGVDVNCAMDRLARLMDEEKIFSDENLTLPILAGMLCMSPHQLSELFNSRLNINFKAYVNSYRINEAMRLLREEKDMTVLAIGYRVGFNSKSNFYSVFARHAGKTPVEYRRGLS